MPRRARGDDLEVDREDVPAEKKSKRPWDEYLAKHRGLLRNRGLFGIDEADMLAYVQKCVAPPGRPERLRVFRRRETESNVVQLDSVDISTIPALTSTFYSAAEFFSQHILVLYGSDFDAAFDLVLLIYARVYAHVHTEKSYVYSAKVDVYGQTMRAIVPLVVRQGPILPGDALATVAFANATSNLIPLEKDEQSFFGCILFAYSATDATIWNPLSEVGRADNKRIQQQRESARTVLMTGQRPPYPASWISSHSRLSEAELDAKGRTARRSEAWRLFCKHIYEMMRPQDLGKNLYTEEEWAAHVRMRGSDASAIIHWIAYVVQTYTSSRCIPLLVSVSEQCGKGTLLYILQRVLGPLVYVCSPHVLEGQFLEEFESVLIAGLDEVGAAFKKEQLLETIKRLSAAIANSFGRKFQTPTVVAGRLNFMMLTNGGSIHVNDKGNVMTRPWPLAVGGGLRDPDHYTKVYETFRDLNHCFNVYLALSRFPLPPGYQPSLNRPVGVVQNYEVMMTSAFSIAVRALHDVILEATHDETPLVDLVESAKMRIPHGNHARTLLREDTRNESMLRILRQLSTMGLFEMIRDHERGNVLRRHVQRDTPVHYRGDSLDAFLEF